MYVYGIRLKFHNFKFKYWKSIQDLISEKIDHEELWTSFWSLFNLKLKSY
jgi:hypothetical protein